MMGTILNGLELPASCAPFLWPPHAGSWRNKGHEPCRSKESDKCVERNSPRAVVRGISLACYVKSICRKSTTWYIVSVHSRHKANQFVRRLSVFIIVTSLYLSEWNHTINLSRGNCPMSHFWQMSTLNAFPSQPAAELILG